MYYRRNPEKYIQAARTWRENNPDRYREYQRRYYAEHEEIIRTRVRAYQEGNPEQKRAAQRRYRVRHSERLAAEARSKYAALAGTDRAKVLARNRANSSRYRTHHLPAIRRYMAVWREANRESLRRRRSTAYWGDAALGEAAYALYQLKEEIANRGKR